MKTMFLSICMLLLCILVKAQKPSGVELARTKDSAMAYLRGTAVFDPNSQNYISYKWFLQSGVTAGNITIVSPTSMQTKVRGLIPGSYQFGFVIIDSRLGKADTAYTTITVKKG
ncbi:MAG: hypothetical protein JST87_00115 [Bacteroidetes bacterium]|nr:hypothetical protein [Bacteroidota bacterium]